MASCPWRLIGIQGVNASFSCINSYRMPFAAGAVQLQGFPGENSHVLSMEMFAPPWGMVLTLSVSIVFWF